jgi:hypothetical protein
LTESQTISDSSADYLKTSAGFLHGDRFGRFELKLLQLESGRNGVAQLQVSAGRDRWPIRGKSRVNHPLRWQGLEFHLGAAIGYSPQIVLWDQQGQQRFRSFVRIHNREAGTDSVIHEDYLNDIGNGQRLHIRVLPPPGDGTPEFELAIMAEQKILAQGSLVVGDTLTLAGTRISIPQSRRWCYIFVVRNPWLNVVFAGFWLALIGQAISAIARVTSRKGGSHE